MGMQQSIGAWTAGFRLQKSASTRKQKVLWLMTRCNTRCRTSFKLQPLGGEAWCGRAWGKLGCCAPGPEVAGEGRQGADRPAWGGEEAA